MRIALMAVALVFAFGATAKADEFFLAADGVSVEKRVGAVEQRVAAESALNAQMRMKIDKLERKVADLLAFQQKEGRTAVPSEARGPVNPIVPTKIVWQVCVNGKCSRGECENLNQVPVGATIMNPAALGLTAASGAPCPTGPCGDNCQCAGTMSVGASASSGDGGWYLGKNLGRRARGARGCASCGN